MIDLKELRRLAEKADKFENWRYKQDSIDEDDGEGNLDVWGDIYVKCNQTIAHEIHPNYGNYIAAANPSTVIELLNERSKLLEVLKALRSLSDYQWQEYIPDEVWDAYHGCAGIKTEG